MTITATSDPYSRVKYLSQMNLSELIQVVENENIPISKNKGKKTILAEIKKARALRGESTR